MATSKEFLLQFSRAHTFGVYWQISFLNEVIRGPHLLSFVQRFIEKNYSDFLLDKTSFVSPKLFLKRMVIL